MGYNAKSMSLSYSAIGKGGAEAWGIKWSKDEAFLIGSAYNRYCGGGPLVDNIGGIKHIKPDFAATCIEKAIHDKALAPTGMKVAERVKAKMESKLNLKVTTLKKEPKKALRR